MNSLERNFTSPEQAKKLMELGVPAWTADCYRWDFGEGLSFRYSSEVHSRTYDYQKIEGHRFPCWSVAQLQRIFRECAKEDSFYYAAADCAAHQDNIIESWCIHFLAAEVLLDLSKLKRKDYE